MARPPERLACLALMLSPLSPGAHRTTGKDVHLHNGSLSTIVGDERQALVHNTCKGVGRFECTTKKKDTCVWDGDQPEVAFRCKPNTCTNPYGSDCKELTSQCQWNWDNSKGIGQCLNKVKAILRDNPCKDLGLTDCYLADKECRWDFVEMAATACRPKSCAGIKGSDCRELTNQCTWEWDKQSKTGQCLEQATTLTLTTSVMEVGPGVADPCKGLSDPECVKQANVCESEWNVQTQTMICRPRACAGIKGSDCKALSGKCLFEMAKHTCEDVPKGLQGVPDLCKGFTVTDCQANKKVCEWDGPHTCKPRTCKGLWFIDCLSLLHSCTWHFEQSQDNGTCVDDADISTTATTTSAGSRTARFASLLLVYLLAVKALFV